jgi:ribonuclease HI
MLIEVYSDGSGNTFDSDGGYGWRLVVDGVLTSEGNGYLPRATNNVAELTAAIKGLDAAAAYINSAAFQSATPPKVVLVSDSQLVLGYANGSYQCKALHLTSLYISLRKVYGSLKADTRWVRGHSGDEHNEGCDKLAKAGRESKGIGTSATNSVHGTTHPDQQRDGDGEEV